MSTLEHAGSTPAHLDENRIFTWHEDDIAKRLGFHGENALVDVDRKSLKMRLAKLWFRLRHLLEAGLLRAGRLDYELFLKNSRPGKRTVPFSRLSL